jgi:hypothetical protein
MKWVCTILVAKKNCVKKFFCKKNFGAKKNLKKLQNATICRTKSSDGW